MDLSVDKLEQQLDSFDPAQRKDALCELYSAAGRGEIELSPANDMVNLHCHTFFSYNAYGYSPSKFAWLAKKAGLAVAGIVDFDVLDGLEEFFWAGAQLGLRCVVGMESRVYVPEFADKVINSPGEPGVSYHMGVGFTNADVTGDAGEFRASLGKTSAQRNRVLIDKVNEYLDPVELDYDRDVICLTPGGNATERHICLAYARKAASVFGDGEKLANFWAEKLGEKVSESDLPKGRALQGLIRAKTMKRGGVGYVKPGAGSFPGFADMNEFIVAADGISTHTWLDGISDGEQGIEKLLAIEMGRGVGAINIIPDRNYTSGSKDQKLSNLYRIVEIAEKLDLLIVSGTEMNSPGQRFVDDFESAELKPLLPVFLKSAYAIYGHSVLQRRAQLGYGSEWAGKNFDGAKSKNEFFEKVGRIIEPGKENVLSGLTENLTPAEILKRIVND